MFHLSKTLAARKAVLSAAKKARKVLPAPPLPKVLSAGTTAAAAQREQELVNLIVSAHTSSGHKKKKPSAATPKQQHQKKTSSPKALDRAASAAKKALKARTRTMSSAAEANGNKKKATSRGKPLPSPRTKLNRSVSSVSIRKASMTKTKPTSNKAASVTKKKPSIALKKKQVTLKKKGSAMTPRTAQSNNNKGASKAQGKKAVQAKARLTSVKGATKAASAKQPIKKADEKKQKRLDDIMPEPISTKEAQKKVTLEACVAALQSVDDAMKNEQPSAPSTAVVEANVVVPLSADALLDDAVASVHRLEPANKKEPIPAASTVSPSCGDAELPAALPKAAAAAADPGDFLEEDQAKAEEE